MRMAMPDRNNSMTAVHIQIGLLLVIVNKAAKSMLNGNINFLKNGKWFHESLSISKIQKSI